MSCSALPLTVHEILLRATQEIEVQGDATSESLRNKFNEILQGRFPITYDVSEPSTHSLAALQALGPLLLNTKLGKVSKQALSQIQRYLPSLTYAALAQGVLQAWTKVHHSVSSKKELMRAENSALEQDRELQRAQDIATDTIIHLVFLLHCPRVHPCERMYALYFLNTLHLLGSQGIALARHLARTNRFYFSSDGTLLEFDPSKSNHVRPKRINALVKFLRTICVNEKQYRRYLTTGIEYGITLLKPYIAKSWDGRESTFAWHYAAGLFKALSNVDVLEIRTVDPERIFSKQINTDFLKIMILCSLEGHNEETWQDRLLEAKQLIATNNNKLLDRYYQESIKRYYNRIPLP
jgi:hypothetical protein